MTPPGALAITGAILMLAAFIGALVADETGSRYVREFRVRIAWALLFAAVACLIGAPWWEALR